MAKCSKLRSQISGSGGAAANAVGFRRKNRISSRTCMTARLCQISQKAISPSGIEIDKSLIEAPATLASASQNFLKHLSFKDIGAHANPKSVRRIIRASGQKGATYLAPKAWVEAKVRVVICQNYPES